MIQKQAVQFVIRQLAIHLSQKAVAWGYKALFPTGTGNLKEEKERSQLLVEYNKLLDTYGLDEIDSFDDYSFSEMKKAVLTVYEDNLVENSGAITGQSFPCLNAPDPDWIEEFGQSEIELVQAIWYARYTRTVVADIKPSARHTGSVSYPLGFLSSTGRIPVRSRILEAVTVRNHQLGASEKIDILAAGFNQMRVTQIVKDPDEDSVLIVDNSTDMPELLLVDREAYSKQLAQKQVAIWANTHGKTPAQVKEEEEKTTSAIVLNDMPTRLIKPFEYYSGYSSLTHRGLDDIIQILDVWVNLQEQVYEF